MSRCRSHRRCGSPAVVDSAWLHRLWQARPRAVNAPFDRKANALDVSLIPADWIEAGGGKEAVPIITHCGGGGRGQKAKDYLESQACRRLPV